jgi:hypothetical protein
MFSDNFEFFILKINLKKYFNIFLGIIDINVFNYK